MSRLDDKVESVAEAIWIEGYGKHRPGMKWPDDVLGRSQELFRGFARAAIAGMILSEPSDPEEKGRLLRDALELARGRLDLLLRVYPEPSEVCDHPVATRHVLAVVNAALSLTFEGDLKDARS